jgi:colanic acid biosynthesis protein WcaH
MLERNDFLQIVAATPLVSIDLIVQNASDEVLLGLRSNAPAQGYWFVPGGRILKSETLEQAFERITNNELGKAFGVQSAHMIGVFEHHYPNNLADDTFATHYIAIGMSLKLRDDLSSLPKDQHTCYRWQQVESLLASPEVHQNTKDYFIKTEGLRSIL